jgi:glycosyl transferase family 25
MQHFAVLVINLDHSTGRLDSMRQQLGGLGLSWQRVPAIHGEKLTDDQRALFDAEGYRRKHGKTVNWRELGCYLSHLAAMKALLASPFEHGVVLEDDVVVGQDFAAVVDALVRDAAQWDMVKLSGIHSGTPIALQALLPGHDLCVMLSRCTGASAYVVNRRAAQTYLDRLLPMQLPFDHAQDRGWSLGIQVRKVHPEVCTHSYDQGSTIDVAPPKGQRTEAVKLPWYQRLSVYRYRMANEWQRLTHGLATWLRHGLQR